MENALSRAIWMIYLQAEGMSGLLLILVCGTLYAHRRRAYFLYWTLAWLVFGLWRVLTGLALGEAWRTGLPFLQPPVLSYLASVCGWWHVTLWMLGLLHLRSLYQTDEPPAPRGADQRAAPGVGVVLGRSSAARWNTSRKVRAAPGVGVVLGSLAATMLLAVLVRTFLPSKSQAVTSVLMAAVYAASAAWFASRWWRTGQLGAFLLPFSLGLCAAARLYSVRLLLRSETAPFLLTTLYQNALLDFLLQTLTIVAIIVVLLRDEDTLLRETGQRLAESEDRFRLLFEHGGVGMALLSPEGDFQQVNPALEQMLGYPASELVGKHIMDVMHNEDRSSSNRLRGKPDAPQYEREKRFLHSDGHIVWTRLVRVPIRDGQGTIRYHATFFVDVSGHKRAEEALCEQRRMEEQLSRARRMETLVTLVGGIAHDFNNQLTAILGNLDMLRMDLEQWQKGGTVSLDSLRACLTGSEQAGQRCARMTARLLTFSRGRLGSMQTVQLEQVLAETVGALQHELPGIKIDVVRLPALPAVTVDVAQVQELLLNLATNAREAMPHGGTLTLTLGWRTFTPEECARNLEVRPGSFVELCVRDTGRGMPREVRERIFEPFFTTKKPGQGAGMGLAVVFGIVKGHKGWIMVDSEPGKGTAFRVYLPATSVAAPSAPPPAVPAPASAGERILVVDDEPLVRDLAKTVLERMGFRVLTAQDGEEALTAYRREGDRIDLILLDYIMPRMNGVQVLQELRKLNPDVCVVFSSGYHTDHEVDQLLAAGARGFVAKPYRTQDLVQAIRRALGDRR